MGGEKDRKGVTELVQNICNEYRCCTGYYESLHNCNIKQ